MKNILKKKDLISCPHTFVPCNPQSFYRGLRPACRVWPGFNEWSCTMNPHPCSLRFRQNCSSSPAGLSALHPEVESAETLLPEQTSFSSASSAATPVNFCPLTAFPHLHHSSPLQRPCLECPLCYLLPWNTFSFLPSFRFFLSNITSEMSEPTLPPASIPWDYYSCWFSCLGGNRGSVSLYPQCLLDAWLLGHAWHMLKEWTHHPMTEKDKWKERCHLNLSLSPRHLLPPSVDLGSSI